MTLRCFLTGALFIIFTVTALAQTTIDAIPNQKLINGSYVSNPDGILSTSTVAQIDTILRSLEAKATAQVAVVVVESIGEADIFEFAQKLFKTWGIGQKQNDNGLLVLFVNDQRTVRFHTGDGLEGVLPDVICKRIQRDFMVPAFKNKDYNAGMLTGIQQVAKILGDPAYAAELKTEDDVSPWTGFVTFLLFFAAPVPVIAYWIKAANGKFRESKDRRDNPYPEMRLKRWPWLIEFVGIPILIIVLFSFNGSEGAIAFCVFTLYCYYMLTLFHRLYRMQKVIRRFLAIQDYYEIVEFLRKQQWYWFLIAILFPFPFVIYFFYHFMRKRIYRNHPRNCKECTGKMKKLNDTDEDEFLTEKQQLEEKLRAVDYDVWKCVSCASVEFWFYLNRHSKYTPCPKCRTIAYYPMSRRTITSATYSSSGTGEEIQSCKFCGHQHRSTYSIAQLVHTTSSSSSSSGSSSSSSSGGSWGGGSSSGGGASSSW